LIINLDHVEWNHKKPPKSSMIVFLVLWTQYDHIPKTHDYFRWEAFRVHRWESIFEVPLDWER